MNTIAKDIAHVKNLQQDFPMLHRKINGQSITYMDSAATSLKPQQVIDSVTSYYRNYSANVHRGVNLLAEAADKKFTHAREVVAEFINSNFEEVIFTSGTTDAMNMVCDLLSLDKDDEVICSIADHHSAMLPWRKNAKVVYAGINADGSLNLEDYHRLITDKTRLVIITQVSNVLGVVNPIHKIIEMAHQKGVPVLVDAAQSAPHLPIDVQELDCDFLAFSGHKMLGPTGTGVLYGKAELLRSLAPKRLGGGMVRHIGKHNMTLQDIPYCFEAGTPNIAGVIGLATAIDYLSDIGMDNIWQHEQALADALIDRLSDIKGVTLFPAGNKSRIATVSFTIDNISADDIARLLSNRAGIMVRSGVHCAALLAEHLGINSMVRASLYVYNTLEDVDKLCGALQNLQRYLGRN